MTARSHSEEVFLNRRRIDRDVAVYCRGFFASLEARLRMTAKLNRELFQDDRGVRKAEGGLDRRVTSGC
ncbi:MAG: hypothetical protein U9M98_01730 [Patescibacteria group bacterium]|nr:hypothetical protein [Patescibacteria group bacterium]